MNNENDQETRARLMRRINAASVWVQEAEYLAETIALDEGARRQKRRGMLDALLGFVGIPISDADKAERNLAEARAELRAARREYDLFVTRGAAE